MRLKHLYLDDFKNLKKFSIDFSDESFIDIIIGKNGSGKSNLLEAVIEIFRSLIDEDYILESDYTIKYINDEKDIVIETKNGKLNKLLRNGKPGKRIGKKDLPENVLIYYSGHNERVASLINEYEDNYRKSIKGSEVKDLRTFFGVSNDHKSILMMILLLLGDDNKARESIMSQLNISEIDSDIKIVLKKPYFFKGELDAWDTKPFWGVKGYLKEFFKDFATGEPPAGIVRDEGYIADNEEYVCYFTPEAMKNMIANHTPQKVFQYFDDLRVIGMLSSIDFEIKLVSGKTIAMHNLSDGEFQTVFFSGLLELFKEKNYIMLLDEPDAFLHPEWQFKLVKQIIELSEETAHENHILLSSHNASTLVSSGDKKVNLFQVEDDKVKNIAVSRGYAIRQLSAGLIALNEQEQTLSIINKIRIENKPILFTEGSSDPLVIKEAWLRLREAPLPFIPIYAFCDTYLHRLMQDQKIYNENRGKPLFGLFDFDEAYNQWNGIEGEDEEIDPFKGLCRKVGDKNGYIFLLPVPDNDEIKPQIIKNEQTKETFLHESELSIELLFYGYDGTKNNFEKEDIVGGGSKIVFKGDKCNFAEKIVPNLPKEAFQVFEPMFAFIESKIN